MDSRGLGATFVCGIALALIAGAPHGRQASAGEGCTHAPPAPFAGAALAWDAGCERWVAFGGATPSGFTAALLVLEPDAGVWVPEVVDPRSPVPPARALGAATVTGAGTLLIFGGDSGGSQARDDTWAYDFTCHWWWQFAPKPGDQNPDPRVKGDLSFDQQTGQVTLKGGRAQRGGPPLTDAWRLDLEVQQWVRLW